MSRADLHAHTTESDGLTPPRELVRLAKRAGVGILAVTDHDTVAAVPVCIEEGASCGVCVVPGIELSTRFENHDVHVLGYGLDFRSAELLEFLAGLRDRRRKRVEAICGKLAGLGVALDPADVLREAAGNTVGRKHVARALVAKGAVAHIKEAFARYLEEGAPAHVPAGEMTPGEAARLVRRHGGLPVLAHPGFLPDDGMAERIVDAAPMAGIEVYHRYRSSVRHLKFLEMAHRRNLLATGGSDYHGEDDPRNGLLGAFPCPSATLREMRRRLPATFLSLR